MPSQLFKDVKKGLPPSVSVLEGNAGDSITITVDVAEMTFPYSVVWEGETIIFGFTDRSETRSDLLAGVYVLSWSFSHGAKNWKHEIKAKVGQKAAAVLDSRSESKKDKPFTIGSAVIVIN